MRESEVYECHQGQYLISTDPARLDVDAIHEFLTHSYWTPGIPRATIEQALRHSLCFGLYDGDAQIGLVRVVTDYTGFAYICDVFVLKAYRGSGLGTWLVECAMQHPALRDARMVLLATRDAHGLYAKMGFEALANPEKWMVIRRQQPWYQPDQVIE